MEANTFATTVYVQAPAGTAFAYLRRLQNLDEWTLGSRMRTRIDDDTYMGTASGYQAMLCYHVNGLEHPRLGAIEWQCGYRYQEYFKQYPVFVFPSRYADPTGDEDGCYVHWVSVVDPARRTEMIMQGIAAVHHYESRGLKAAIERGEGVTEPAAGKMALLSDTMWVDAPIEIAHELLSDRGTLAQWAPHFHPVDAAAGSFVDEYGREVQIDSSGCRLGEYGLIEQDYLYRGGGRVQRCPIVLVPSARAFGADAPGFLLHRIAFARGDGSQMFGRTSTADLAAESMAIKRILEARAGNTASFARGMS